MMPDKSSRQAAVKNWKHAIGVAVEMDDDLMNTKFFTSQAYKPLECKEMLELDG